PFRRLGRAAVPDEARERLELVFLHRPLAREHERRRPVVEARPIRRGDGSVLRERRLQRGELRGVALRRALVVLHDGLLALLLRRAHRLDLGGEEALSLRRERRGGSLLRKLVLLGAGDLVFGRAFVAAV